MSLDVSRFTFSPWNDFLGVVMQQGRVQLDADWNELVAQLIRRVQAGTLDTLGTLGRTTVPLVTKDAFRITAAGGKISIGVGRMYVDGILVENHGTGTFRWDPATAELVGTEEVDYLQQPYHPAPPALPAGGPHLAYLDVWQREITHLQHPALLEKAVGVDTTARLQTVWQVKVLPNIGAADCASKDEDVPGWADVTRPTASRLTTSTATIPGAIDPCLVPVSGGYKGLENQLYRVEIHDGGPVGAATFKWSRDNGSVQTLVQEINAARDRLVVASVGHDDVLRFSDGDWIEITDDVRELGGRPGVIRRIRIGGGVDDATRTIVLASALPNEFPTTGTKPDPARHTRIRRWDQAGAVLSANGTVYRDLNAAGSTGVIPIPAGNASVVLEHGVVVKFTLDGAGGFRSGDHWSFAARTEDASIEILDGAPPRGIHHHHARLAVVTMPGTATSCRTFWPPESEGGDDCSCDACVSVEGHNNGTADIQKAIDKVAKTGGVVCLGIGTYRIREPLRIDGAVGLTIRGKGLGTVLVPTNAGAVISVQNSIGVELHSFSVAGASEKDSDLGLIAVSNCTGLSLERLSLLSVSRSGTTAGVTLDGFVLGAQVRECAIMADLGVAGGNDVRRQLLTAALTIADNLFVCNRSGVSLGERSVHSGIAAVSRNLVMGCREASVLSVGGTLPNSSFRIDDNTLYLKGDGIVVGTDDVHVTGNSLARDGTIDRAVGILLTSGLNPRGMSHAVISGNHLGDISGAAIDVRTAVRDISIGNNVIERARNGIVYRAKASGERLVISGNTLESIAAGHDPATSSIIGIQVLATKRVDIVGNVFARFALQAVKTSDRVAIRVAACGDVRICANRMSDVGPADEHEGEVTGIDVVEPYVSAMVNDNVITRAGVGAKVGPARWHAVRLSAPDVKNGSRLTGAALVRAGAQLFLMTAGALYKVEPTAPRVAALRGNQFSAAGVIDAIVLARGPASCMFLDNYCDATFAAIGLRQAFVVRLAADTVMASNNRIRSMRDDPVMEIDSKQFTVLGNITSGGIIAGSAPLGLPWQPMNLTAN